MIILIDSLDRVVDVISIGTRTLRIARQSIWVGLGLSGIAMLVAAFGYLPPVIGAALQEVIDIAVILNALRSAANPLSEWRKTRLVDPTKRPATLPRVALASQTVADRLRHAPD